MAAILQSSSAQTNKGVLYSRLAQHRRGAAYPFGLAPGSRRLAAAAAQLCEQGGGVALSRGTRFSRQCLPLVVEVRAGCRARCAAAGAPSWSRTGCRWLGGLGRCVWAGGVSECAGAGCCGLS